MSTDYAQSMIYIDDGSYGAEVHGNVFVRTIGDQSRACNNHGSQHSDMRGNIFIDVGSAFVHHGWSEEDSPLQDTWILYLYDIYENGYGTSQKLLNVDFDSELWREHYSGTIWEKLYDYVDSERIAAYAGLSYDEMLPIAKEIAPYASNVLSENVFVNVGRDEDGNPYRMGWGAGVTCENNYDSNDTSIFESYENDDFTLTKEGLAKVREVIPGFENVPFDEMGIVK